MKNILLAEFLIVFLSSFSLLSQAKTVSIGLTTLYDIWNVSATKGNKHQKVFIKPIYNKGDTIAFVLTSVFEILNPAESSMGKPEKTKQLSAKELIKKGLVISPTHIILPPKQQNQVKVYYIQEATKNKMNKDLLLRLNFTPVIPKKDSGFNLTKAQEKEAKANVGILIGYGSILVIRPHNPHHDLSVKKQKTGIVVNNKGNTVEVIEIKGFCASKKSKTFICSQQTGRIKKHVYGGQRIFLPYQLYKHKKVAVNVMPESKKS